MAEQADAEKIPGAAREIIDFYEARADELRFPDLDADVLAQAATALVEARQQVADAQAGLARARDVERGHEEALMSASRRALAYARIFAETNPGLAETLAGFQLAKQPDEKPARSPVRRRKKVARSTESLAEDDPVEELRFEDAQSASG